ncbi:EAL domain-containing protein [Alginatibacterium sediminis]|uniref:EAL domain-containing protein n=1 Tax=Alginatibacterium sediminis TaxID=2164068 RepID=A0A420ECR5_9ALTE|nr:GGDEF domain-containing phosphodiesterase [Alginatibacterium sediminis]RKF18455.1 EAL domain-containing protein [Alginatibacterium sediminis]
MKSQARRFRLTVVNQVLFVLGLVLLIGLAGLVNLNERNFDNFAQEEQQFSYLNYERQLGEFVEETMDYLRVSARSHLAQVDFNHQADDRKLINYWRNLYIYSHLPILGAEFFEESQEVDQHRHRFGYSKISERAKKVLLQNTEEQSWVVDCNPHCIVYFTVTVERLNRPSLQAFYGLDAGRFLNAFPLDLDSHHIAISPDENGNYHAVYASEAIKGNVEKILELVKDYDLNQNLHHIDYSGRNFEFRVSDVGMQSSPVYLIKISDITKRLAKIESIRQKNSWYSVLIISLSLFASLIILRTLLRRVSRTIRLLPLLAHSNFERFRQRMALQNRRWFHDESDDIGRALKRLSHQLENYESDLKGRALELEWTANYDALTELPNRNFVAHTLQKRLITNEHGALLLVDIDNFKYVNDISGHDVGDELLIKLAEQIKKIVASDHLVARLSSDEFLIFGPDLSIRHAQVLGQRINVMANQLRVAGSGIIHNPTVSVGIAVAPEHGERYEDLMTALDLCIQEAKNRGKNCVVTYQQDLRGEDFKQQHYWLEKAKTAIGEQQLELFYQPILNNNSQMVQHYEVLLRVRDSSGGLQSAYPLILAAEQHGLIEAIDRYVVQCALTQLESNMAHGHLCRLAVNLSGRSFCSEDLISSIVHEIKMRKVDASYIIFEITESAALSDLELAQKHIQALKELGCQLALDDFGVGYSSFHSLSRLSFDFIKIDGSFVRDIEHNPNHQVFVRALVDIAKQLGYQTIAEFVETQNIQQATIDLGVDFSQGYHIGKPAPASQYWQIDRTAEVLLLSKDQESSYE